MLWTVIIVLLVLAALGTFPSWPHSVGWGYGPSGGAMLVLIVIIIILLVR